MHRKNITVLFSMFLLLGGIEIKSSSILQAIRCPDLFGEVVETTVQQVEKEITEKVTEQIATQTISETIIKESSINTFKNIGKFALNCAIKTGAFCLHNPKPSVAIFFAITAVAGYIGTKYKQKQLDNAFRKFNTSLNQTFEKKKEKDEQEQQKINDGLRDISSLMQQIINKQQITENAFEKITKGLEETLTHVTTLQENSIKKQQKKIEQHEEYTEIYQNNIEETIKYSEDHARKLLLQLEPDRYTEENVIALTPDQIETALCKLIALKSLKQITREAENLKVFNISGNKQKVRLKEKSQKISNKKNSIKNTMKNEKIHKKLDKVTPFSQKINQSKFNSRKGRQMLKRMFKLRSGF